MPKHPPQKFLVPFSYCCGSTPARDRDSTSTRRCAARALYNYRYRLALCVARLGRSEREVATSFCDPQVEWILMKMSILKYFSRGKSKRPDTSSSSASAISESDESNCEIVEVEDSEEPQLSPLAVPVAVVRNDIGTFMEDIAKGAPLDDDVMFALLKDHVQPDSSFVFPKNGGRSFQPRWLDVYKPWLVFSPSLSGGVCVD